MTALPYSLTQIADTALPSPTAGSVAFVIGSAKSPRTTVARYRAAQSQTDSSPIHCITPRSNRTAANSGDTMNRWYQSDNEVATTMSAVSDCDITSSLFIAPNIDRGNDACREFVEEYATRVNAADSPVTTVLDSVSVLSPWIPHFLDLLEESPATIIVAGDHSLLNIVRAPYQYAAEVCYTSSAYQTTSSPSKMSLSDTARNFLETRTSVPRVVRKRAYNDHGKQYELASMYRNYDLHAAL